MRIDKFLKDSRLIKRRAIAKQMCDAGKIKINGKTVKASATVMVDNEITIEYAKMIYTVKVSSLHINASKALAASCYEEITKIMKAD